MKKTTKEERLASMFDYLQRNVDSPPDRMVECTFEDLRDLNECVFLSGVQVARESYGKAYEELERTVREVAEHLESLHEENASLLLRAALEGIDAQKKASK